MQKRSTKLALFGWISLLSLCAFIFFWNLGASSISVRSDEVIYVRTTQSILHNGDLLPLKHGNVPMYEKPPLKLWLGSLAPFVLGESNLSFRLLDGILGIFVVALTAYLAYVITQSHLLGVLSGALLLGMPELIIAQHSFRHAVLDGLLCALTIVGGLLSWRIVASQESPIRRDTCILGVVWSLAVLTKSVAGIVPAACSLLAIIVSRYNRATIRSWSTLAWLIILPALTFVAYATVLWLLAGVKALTVFLGVEILDRALSGFEGHNTGSSGFYLRYLFMRAGAVPQALLCSGLIGACIVCLRRNDMRFLLVWALCPVALYSCAASRVPWYLSPYFPFLSILSVAGVTALVACIRERTSKRMAALVLTLIVVLSAGPYYRALDRNVREVLHDTDRLEIDTLVEGLKGNYSSFAIVENSISGHSNPRNGRFNIEGIYRELLRPNLRAVQHLSELERKPNEVLFMKETSIPALPSGWREIGRLAPYGGRSWSVVAVVYPPESL
jgi:4-amino-4-deoxy-L-arabinose transferase-like glycosyltransferase